MWVQSGGVKLSAHIARPTRPGAGTAGALVVHGFPVGGTKATNWGRTYPRLADRIANDIGIVALSLTLRGCGDSGGDFSLRGWYDDLRAGIEHLVREEGVHGVWMAGSAMGGSLSICVGAEDRRVRGVAALAALADFNDLASHPRRFLEHARDVEVIHSPTFPTHLEPWTREFRQLRPYEAVQAFSPRPLLLLHGSDDDQVPLMDSRALADAHGAADLRVIQGAGHRLRHDPRAMAVLFGWLDRQVSLAGG